MNKDNSLYSTSSKNSYLLNKTEGYLVKEGAVVGFVLGLCMAYLLWYAYKVVFVYDFTSLKDFNWLAWVIIAAITVISLVIGFFIIIKPLEKIVDSLESKVSSFKKGFEGEDHVVNALRESLDGSCHIFRNLHFNGRKEDIDVALVSPWGVFAIEVKKPLWNF